MGVHDEVTLGAGLSAVGWVRAGRRAPFLDGAPPTGASRLAIWSRHLVERV